jgi:hypothetical protein
MSYVNVTTPVTQQVPPTINAPPLTLEQRVKALERLFREVSDFEGRIADLECEHLADRLNELEKEDLPARVETLEEKVADLD